MARAATRKPQSGDILLPYLVTIHTAPNGRFFVRAHLRETTEAIVTKPRFAKHEDAAQFAHVSRVEGVTFP